METENIEKAIRLAMTQGYIGVPMKEGKPQWTKDVLSPGFWSALGKAEGWEAIRGTEYTPMGSKVSIYYGEKWQHEWHHFIDHLAEGKNADSFFKGLLE